MSAEVAIVIPAYNAARGLETSVRSALAQTHANVSIWIVDDGSKDDTGEIAERLSRSDSRVKVIHQENSGCYQARLVALKRIKTSYFAFLDADDVMEPTMIARMVDLAERENLDVVQCAYRIGDRTLGTWSDETILHTHAEVVERYVSPALVHGCMGGTFVWNKLYRNKFDFEAFDPTDKDTTFEDMIYNLQFFLTVDRMGFINEPLYRYIINDESSIRNFTEKTIHDFRECIRIRRKTIPRYTVAKYRVLNRYWLLLNVRSALVSAVRSIRLPIMQRIKNAFRVFVLLKEGWGI